MFICLLVMIGSKHSGTTLQNQKMNKYELCGVGCGAETVGLATTSKERHGVCVVRGWPQSVSKFVQSVEFGITILGKMNTKVDDVSSEL